MNAPDMPKQAAASTAMARPTDVDERFMGLLGNELVVPCNSTLVSSE